MPHRMNYIDGAETPERRCRTFQQREGKCQIDDDKEERGAPSIDKELKRDFKVNVPPGKLERKHGVAQEQVTL